MTGKQVDDGTERGVAAALGMDWIEPVNRNWGVVEGKFYVWKVAEVKNLATGKEWEVAERIWEMSEEGNFMDPHHPERGWNVLARKRIPSVEEEKVLESLRAKLAVERSKRIRPGKDDKVLCSWNALAISGYARAARWGGSASYGQKAAEICGFVEKEMTRADGSLIHRCYKVVLGVRQLFAKILTNLSKTEVRF